MNVYYNGLGFTAGSRIVGQLHTPSDVPRLFVSSETGDDTNPGTDRLYPFATLGAAVAAAGGVDETIIVLMEDHAEEFTSAVVVDFIVHIQGEGLNSDGRPAVELTLAAGTHNLLTLSAGSDRATLTNIRFMPPGNAAAPGSSTGHYLATSRDDLLITGCDFYFDRHMDDAGLGVAAAANAWFVQGCTFVSIEESTDPADRPFTPVVLGGAITLLRMENCVFDGGASGFEDGNGSPSAFDGSTGTITSLHAYQIDLLNSCDFVVEPGTSGFVDVRTATGSSRVVGFP